METIGVTLTLIFISVFPVALFKPDALAPDTLGTVVAMETIGVALTLIFMPVFPAKFSEPDTLCAILELGMKAIGAELPPPIPMIAGILAKES